MYYNSVLITGSSKGIGKSLALTFAQKGYPIILHGRDINCLRNTRDIITKSGGEAFILRGDLREEKTLDNLYLIGKKKNISLLINNAAVLCPGLPLENLSYEKIQEMIETNLIAPIKLTKKLYSLLSEGTKGTIININSLSGIENQKFRSIYCATKWGLRGFTDTLRLESSEKNIRIMGVYLSQVKDEKKDVGLNLDKICQEIYTAYLDENIDELIIDGRPEKYRIKKKIMSKTLLENY